LKKEILVVNTRPTFSRVREIWIPGIECSLMLLHKNLHIMIRDPRDNHNEVKRRIHVDTVERMDMLRRNDLRRRRFRGEG
jgi:hypothetical protein